MRPLKSKGYRPDIDGLRAVAVLAVIVNHVSSVLPGGFIGVDVFFVISGYLITNILCAQLRTDSFSVAAFYARRVRRLFPSLSLLLIASLAAGWVLLSTPAFEDLAGDVVASATFVANLRQLVTADYFASASANKPLLHLWSLGVEEQFYLLWPIALAVIWRWPRRRAVVAAIATASFALNVMLTSSHPTAAFYSPVTRIWELLVGCTLALAGEAQHAPEIMAARYLADQRVFRVWVSETRLRNIASVTGITLVVLAMFVINENSAFPGYWVLLPCLGTVLLIVAGESTWVNRVVLSNRAAVWVGLLSYPLYLFHWPALAFMRIVVPDASHLVKLLVLSPVPLLAYLAYRFVERPIRRRSGTKITGGLIGAQIAFVVIGVSIVHLHGIPTRFDEPRRSLMAFGPPDSVMMSLERKGTCLLRQDQTANEFAADCYSRSGTAEMPSVLLWGDSYAAALAPGMREVMPPGTAFQQLTGAGCAPILGAMFRRSHCVAINRFVLDYVRQYPPHTVFLGAQWNTHPDFERVSVTIRALKRAGVARVVVVGSLIQYDPPLPRLLLRSLTRTGAVPIRLQASSLRSLLAVDSTLRAAATREGAEFVAPLDAQCSSEGCLAALDGTVRSIMAWDSGHLTRVGSRFVAQQALRPFLVPPLDSPAIR